MTLERLGELLDAYGADPERWPPEERDAALVLLAQSAPAQHRREANAQLDTILDLAPAHAASPALRERILAAAPEPASAETAAVEPSNRLACPPGGTVDRRQPHPSRRSQEKGPPQGERKLSFARDNRTARPEEPPPEEGGARWRKSPVPVGRRASRRFRAWRYVGAAVPLAAAAALVLWLLREPAPAPERTRVTMAELGTYDVPTDVLLTTPSLDALDSIPSFGCAGSGLGCLDPEPLNKQSALDWETYV